MKYTNDARIFSSVKLSKFDMHYVLNILNYLSTLSFSYDMLKIFTGTIIERWIKPLGTLMISRVY